MEINLVITTVSTPELEWALTVETVVWLPNGLECG